MVSGDGRRTGQGRWLTTPQAAARLGVKPATLYAYASRGLLHPQRAPDGRTSRFDPAEIEQLAARGRRAVPPAPAGPEIATAITAIDHGVLYYRGVPAAEMARAWSFEEAAEWLWSDAFPARAIWRADPDAVKPAIVAQAALPPATLPFDRLRVSAAVLAALDAGARESVAAPARLRARRLIAGLVESLPFAAHPTAVSTPGAGPRPASTEGTLAARLWARLCPAPPVPALVAILNAAMVLLADHEPGAVTLAVRTVASAGGNLHAVVGAGLAALSSHLHGGALTAAATLIAGAERPAPASRPSPGGRGETPTPSPEFGRGGRGLRAGFGHDRYPEGDPRAAELLALLRTAAPHGRLDAVEAVLDAARERRLPPPNVDFALAALVHAAGMVPGAAQAIVAIARAAGWIAHAFEEYARGEPIRPHAVYTGPPPRSRASPRPAGYTADARGEAEPQMGTGEQ